MPFWYYAGQKGSDVSTREATRKLVSARKQLLEMLLALRATPKCSTEALLCAFVQGRRAPMHQRGKLHGSWWQRASSC